MVAASDACKKSATAEADSKLIGSNADRSGYWHPRLAAFPATSTYSVISIAIMVKGQTRDTCTAEYRIASSETQPVSVGDYEGDDQEAIPLARLLHFQ